MKVGRGEGKKGEKGEGGGLKRGEEEDGEGKSQEMGKEETN